MLKTVYVCMELEFEYNFNTIKTWLTSCRFTISNGSKDVVVVIFC